MERLPGFRDFYPAPLPASEAWGVEARQYIFECWRATARRYGFQEYDGPPLEPLELFTLKSGAEIAGQLYAFKDKGEREVALRPEMTPTLARMAAARERQYKKPLRWFAIPQLFRYERAQKGRLREHFQFNADILGEADGAADAELIALLVDTLRGFGLTAEDFAVRLSSRKAWEEYFCARCADASRACEFYQVVDKLERESPEVSERRLADLGLSLAGVQEFIRAGEPTPGLAAILDDLAARGLESYVKVDYGVVRGLAYYTGPVFEAFDRRGSFRAIAGGGRYDNLLKLVSGGKVDLPALGFGMGDVVLGQLLQERGLLPAGAPGLDLYCLIGEESLRRPSLRIVQELREGGLAVDYSLTAQPPRKQWQRALELGATCVIRLECQAGAGPAIKLRHLQRREETTVEPGRLVVAVCAALAAPPAAGSNRPEPSP